MTRLDRAIIFSASAHAGQERKYNGLPYVTHPIEVMIHVSSVPAATEDMKIAALLHDVLEDTEVKPYEIVQAFGLGVHDLVVELTKVEIKGNRAERKAAERERLAACSIEAQTIKLADILSNTRTIAIDDPHFAATYLQEQHLLVEALKGGNLQLQASALSQIRQQYMILRGGASVCAI
jgi:(p)ppGpp synthase/HD superfamily hydrolase